MTGRSSFGMLPISSLELPTKSSAGPAAKAKVNSPCASVFVCRSNFSAGELRANVSAWTVTSGSGRPDRRSTMRPRRWHRA